MNYLTHSYFPLLHKIEGADGGHVYVPNWCGWLFDYVNVYSLY